VSRSRLRVLAAVLGLSILAVACSGGSSGSSGAGDADESGGTEVASVPTTDGSGDAVPGNPGTLVAPTTTTEPPPFLLPVEPTVAFLDACIADAGLIGPCHCAAERLGDSFSADDLVVFEDRLAGRNEFSPEVAAVLVDCRGAAAPPEWSVASVERYVTECTKGAPELEDLCRCSVNRAADVVPEARLEDYLAADEAVPSLVDLINTCL
jgi:hypothetical protein